MCSFTPSKQHLYALGPLPLAIVPVIQANEAALWSIFRLYGNDKKSLPLMVPSAKGGSGTGLSPKSTLNTVNTLNMNGTTRSSYPPTNITHISQISSPSSIGHSLLSTSPLSPGSPLGGNASYINKVKHIANNSTLNKSEKHNFQESQSNIHRASPVSNLNVDRSCLRRKVLTAANLYTLLKDFEVSPFICRFVTHITI